MVCLGYLILFPHQPTFASHSHFSSGCNLTPPSVLVCLLLAHYPPDFCPVPFFDHGLFIFNLPGALRRQIPLELIV